MSNSASPDVNTAVIDVWGYVKRLWRFRWLWLAVFAVIVASGAAYALTRPAQHTATQTVLVTIPEVGTDAQAMQQTSTLGGTVATYVKLGTMPVVTDDVLAKHPEIENLEMLRALITVKSAGPLAIDIEATGVDAGELSALVHDVGERLSQKAPGAVANAPAHLKFQLSPIGDPVVTQASSGRLILLVAAGVLALLLATAAVVIADRVRPLRISS